MKTRIISAAVMLALFIPCLFLSHIVLFDIIITLLCLMAVFEMLGCIKQRNDLAISIPSYIVAVFVPLSVRVIDTKLSFSELVLLVFVVFLFYLLSLAVFSHGKIDPLKISLAFVTVFYIIFGFSSIIAIRNIHNGAYLYLLIFISAWISDTGAYFTGVFFGKTKLIPDVSPKKTVEGAIGGLLSCVLSFLIFGLIMQLGFDFTPNYLILALIGVVMSIISMCGDLIASLIKRHFNIKDYSKLIPGHGGIMDRFDSIIATASILSVLVNIPFIINNLL